jgi:MFS family permease
LFAFYAGAGAVGLVTARYSSRAVLVACGAVIGTLSPALFFVDTAAGLLGTVSLVGGALGTVYVILAAVIPQWFRERRGVATGFLFAGIGVSLFALPPAWQFAFERFGVERGYLTVLLLTAATCVLAGVVCDRPPWTDRPSIERTELLDWLGRVARTRRFRLQFVGIGLAFGWYYLLATYSIDLFVHRGLSERAATIAFGSIGGLSVGSRIVSGLIADRTGYHRTFVVSLLFVVCGCFALLVPQLSAVAVAIVLCGIGFGGVATLYVPILIRSYDSEPAVAVVSVFNVSLGVFALGLPPLGMALFAYADSYQAPVALTIVVSAVALLTIAWS